MSKKISIIIIIFLIIIAVVLLYYIIKVFLPWKSGVIKLPEGNFYCKEYGITVTVDNTDKNNRISVDIKGHEDEPLLIALYEYNFINIWVDKGNYEDINIGGHVTVINDTSFTVLLEYTNYKGHVGEKLVFVKIDNQDEMSD